MRNALPHKHRISHKEVPQSDSPRARVLRELLAVAEINHALLMKLLPGLREHLSFEFDVGGPTNTATRVRVTVRERGPYTTLIDLAELPDGTDPWLAPLVATVRLAHDARVAEVTEMAHRRQLRARYPYPNPDMLQPDEKLQVNRLLGEWLHYCLQWGRSTDQLRCPA